MIGQFELQLMFEGKWHISFVNPWILAGTSGSPGVGDFIEDSWQEIAKAVATIGVIWGVPGGDYGVSFAEKLFGGSDKQYAARAFLKLNWVPADVTRAMVARLDEDKDKLLLSFAALAWTYDEIRLTYRAWSEDDLKSGTCSIAFPEGALLEDEHIDKQAYVAQLKIDPAKFKTGTYKFVGGAQDDGWHYDVAVSSIFTLTFEKLTADDYKPVPVTESKTKSTAPPSHKALGKEVSRDVLRRIATVNTQLATTGIDLGSDAANSTDFDAQLNLASGRPLVDIEAGLVEKVRRVAEDEVLFPRVYAKISAQIANAQLFNDPVHGSTSEEDHYEWAQMIMRDTGSTEAVRNVLLEKLYLYCEPVAMYISPDEGFVPDASAQKIAEVTQKILATVKLAPAHSGG